MEARFKIRIPVTNFSPRWHQPLTLGFHPTIPALFAYPSIFPTEFSDGGRAEKAAAASCRLLLTHSLFLPCPHIHLLSVVVGGRSTTWAWHGGLVGLDNPEVVRAAVSVGWMDLVPLLGEIDFVSTVMIFIDFTQRSLGGWSWKISSDEGWGWTRWKYNHVF